MGVSFSGPTLKVQSSFNCPGPSALTPIPQDASTLSLSISYTIQYYRFVLSIENIFNLGEY
jgi:hypothetical protein